MSEAYCCCDRAGSGLLGARTVSRTGADHRARNSSRTRSWAGIRLFGARTGSRTRSQLLWIISIIFLVTLEACCYCDRAGSRTWSQAGSRLLGARTGIDMRNMELLSYEIVLLPVPDFHIFFGIMEFNSYDVVLLPFPNFWLESWNLYHMMYSCSLFIKFDLNHYIIWCNTHFLYDLSLLSGNRTFYSLGLIFRDVFAKRNSSLLSSIFFLFFLRPRYIIYYISYIIRDRQ